MSIYIILFLAISCLFLGIKLYNFVRDLKRVSGILENIRLGDYNRRFHSGIYSKVFIKLRSEINSILDQFEETVFRKQELEQSYKMLVSEISHDIRTPMTSLVGYVEVLNKDDSLTDVEKKEYLRIVYDKSKLLCSLIDNFFELSKLDSDDTIIIGQKIDICKKVKEVLAAFFNEFQKVNIVPELQVSPFPLYVNGDDVSIERILENLLSNAIRYGKSGGVVGIGIREDTEKIWVDVWDKGKGIPSEELKYVFQRLYTTEKSRNGKLFGSGLGLTITKKLVEKMNGEIFVSSIPNIKTVFSFYLQKYY